MRYVSLFSGIEAATVAWEPLGWEPMAFSEINPFACTVLENRFPQVPNLGDVTEIDWRVWLDGNRRPDLLVGGSPCQSFSIAGGRESLQGESRLMFEFVRAAKELRPRWVVWENVPGCLSAKGLEGEKGGAFRCLLEELAELGYGLCWRVLDAQFFGVAQRRRRVFLVGCLGNLGSAFDVLFEPESVPGGAGQSKQKRAELAARAGRSPEVAGFKYSAGAKASSIGLEEENSNTITADWHAPAVVTLKLRHTGSPNAAGGAGPMLTEDVSCTLATSQDQTLFVPRTFVIDTAHSRSNGLCAGESQVAGTLDTSASQAVWCMADDNGKTAIDRDMCGSVKVGGSAPMVAGYSVRRLTPRECERLQGFPDDWTQVAYRGKTAEECPTGPRYRAIGNSMAVPVMRWIGARIDEAEHR